MKINLALMFGGKSVEHEISIISALQAAQNLDREKYNVIPIYITKSGEMYCGEHIGDIEAYKDIKGLLAKSYPVTMARHGGRVEILRLEHQLFKNPRVSYVDAGFPIVHGTNVEDGTAAGYLNLLGVPYVGCDKLSAAIGMDKYAMKSVFKENGILLGGFFCHGRSRSDGWLIDGGNNVLVPVFHAVGNPNQKCSVGLSRNVCHHHDPLFLLFMYDPICHPYRGCYAILYGVHHAQYSSSYKSPSTGSLASSG